MGWDGMSPSHRAESLPGLAGLPPAMTTLDFRSLSRELSLGSRRVVGCSCEPL